MEGLWRRRLGLRSCAEPGERARRWMRDGLGVEGAEPGVKDHAVHGWMVSKTLSGGEAASVGGRTRVLAQSTQLSGVFGLIAVKDEWSQAEDMDQKRDLIQNLQDLPRCPDVSASLHLLFLSLKQLNLNSSLTAVSFCFSSVELVLCRSKEE